MSAVTAVAGAAVNGMWKLAAIALTVALLIVAGGVGMAWWMAAGDRDTARAALAEEQGISTELRASIGEQNRAVDSMAKATMEAQQRGVAAQAAAAAAGKRYDQVHASLAGVRASTCSDAMPAVRTMLESVR